MEKETVGNVTVTKSSGGAIRRSRRLYTCLKAMARRPESVCFVIAAVCLLLSKVTFSFHQKQITLAAPLPQKFFPSHAGVSDYLLGELQPAIKLLEEEEMIFIMYYASWCAESMSVRSEFIQAARVLNGLVKFVAINCWWPDGECRQRIKFNSYPEFFFYLRGVKDGYRFSGPKSAGYMIRFVENFFYPIQPLHTQEDVKDFILHQDNTVIGYFDFNSSPQPPGGYRQFFLTALRVRAQDVVQPVQFAVVTRSELAQSLGLSVPGKMMLTRLGAQNLVYPDTMNMTSVNMTNWILNNKRKNFVSWLVPPGVKSLTLSSAVSEGPAVLVFAPVNPLFGNNPTLNTIRAVALAYNGCNSEEMNMDDVLYHSYSVEAHSIMNVELQKWKCQQRLFEKQTVPYFQSHCCYCLWTGSKSKQKSVCEYCVHKQNRSVQPACPAGMGSKVISNLHNMQSNACSNFHTFYNVNEHQSLCCKECSKDAPPKVSVGSSSSNMVRTCSDRFVLNGAQTYLKRQCNKFTLQKLKGYQTDSLSGGLRMERELKEMFFGLKCQTNRTVQFYFLDSVIHSHFAKRIVPSSQPHTSTVILVDKKNEAHHVLRENITHESVARFILNYTLGTTRRHLRSSPPGSRENCDADDSLTCVLEISSQTFQSVVMDPYKDVVLFYYAPWCGFCSSFAQTYLSLKNYFHAASNITFARIDGSSNDLPWEFTVEAYPTIIFFPKSKKSDSVVFPLTVEKSLPNLVKFILQHAALHVKFTVAKHMCTSSCRSKNVRRLNDVIAKLTNQISKLQLRSQRLFVRVKELRTPGSLQYAKMTSAVIRKIKRVRQTQLGTAEILKLFLRNGLEKSDLNVVTEFVKNSKD